MPSQPTPVPPDDLSRELTVARPDHDQSLPHIGLVGDTYTILVTGEDTAGKYTLIDMHVPPGGGPPASPSPPGLRRHRCSTPTRRRPSSPSRRRSRPSTRLNCFRRPARNKGQVPEITFTLSSPASYRNVVILNNRLG
jgi:hypothetical protein